MQNEAVALLRCPICSGSFHQEGKSLLCGKRHCYDIAKQGHVNFAPNAKPSFYKKELFESRAKAFEAGVFAPVAAAIGEALEKYVRAERPVVADAGCGEGYYLRSVCPERDMIRIGFDLSKEAVLLAAKGDRRSTYFVGDLANIPLADGCCDAVLDVFTPGELRAVRAHPQKGRRAHQARAEAGLSAPAPARRRADGWRPTTARRFGLRARASERAGTEDDHLYDAGQRGAGAASGENDSDARQHRRGEP